MAKTLTLFLNTSPYNYENTYTAMKIAEAALKKRLDTHLVASADGVYNFLKGQKGSGLPHAEKGFKGLMDKGLKVDLWGGCVNFRCIAEDNYIEGPKKGALKGLFELMKKSDIFINLGI